MSLLSFAGPCLSLESEKEGVACLAPSLGTWPRARSLGRDQIQTLNELNGSFPSGPLPDDPAGSQHPEEAVDLSVVACAWAFQADLGAALRVSSPENQIQDYYPLV